MPVVPGFIPALRIDGQSLPQGIRISCVTSRMGISPIVEYQVVGGGFIRPRALVLVHALVSMGNESHLERDLVHIASGHCHRGTWATRRGRRLVAPVGLRAPVAGLIKHAHLAGAHLQALPHLALAGRILAL